MNTERERPKHGAIALIDEQIFEELLDLPAGVTVHGIYLDPMRRAIILHLVGGCLPELKPGQEAERVWPAVTVTRDTEGKLRTSLRIVLPESGDAS